MQLILREEIFIEIFDKMYFPAVIVHSYRK